MSRRVVVAAVVFGALTFGYRYLAFAEFSNDHFVHLSIAQQITRGALPVRDFVERGLPLMSLLSAAGQALWGEGLRSELFVVSLGFAGAAALTYLSAFQVSGSMTIAALAALVPVLVYPVSYAYPKLLAPAVGLAAAWWYSLDPTMPRAVLFACAGVFAFLLRHDLGVIVGAGALALIIVRSGLTRQSFFDAARLLGIALIIVSPYVLWVQIYQGVGSYAKEGLAFSRREAERANWWWDVPRVGIDTSRPLLTRIGHGPVINVRWDDKASDARIREAEERHSLERLDLNSPGSWQYEMRRWSSSDLENLVKDPLAADTQGIDREHYRLQVPEPSALGAWLIRVYEPGAGLRVRANATAALFYLSWLCAVAAGVALALTWRESSLTLRGVVAMAIVMQLVMDATMLRDPLDTRLRDVLVPTAVLVAYLAGLLWRSAPASRVMSVRRVVITVALFAIVCSAASVGEASVQIDRTKLADGISGIGQRLRTIRRMLSAPDQRTGVLPPSYQTLVGYIRQCTEPDSRLLTLTFAPELFFYTGRGFAGGQVSLSPGYFTGDADASLLLQRVSTEDVPLVVMDSQTQQEMLDGYPRIGAFIRSRYQEVLRVPLTPEKAFVVLGATAARPCQPPV